MPPLRRWAFWFVSQLWTEYRDSPAVVQSGIAKKGPKAGERAPYGSYEGGPEAGNSIFEMLKGTDHHLLLFEGEKPNPERLAATGEEVEALLGRYAVPVNIHRVAAENKSLHKRYGAKTPSLFLIRPDGHVAYRGGAADLVGLKMYLDRLFVVAPKHVRQNDGTRVPARSVRV